MFDKTAKKFYLSELDGIEKSGMLKEERLITGPQGNKVDVLDGKVIKKDIINMCANNYLGLSSHPEVIKAAVKSYERYKYGMSSVRFICGTLDIHKELEHKLTKYLDTEDTILYSSCFDANTGLFETLLSEQDAIISDELNHASIIDGIRLCKAARYRYKNNDMNDLEEKLKMAQNARFRLIATDGVFSMDGIIANLKDICDLADRYNAMVMVDDSHATGFMGGTGRGTPELCGVGRRVDIITSTLGKALGGASGGFVSGRGEIVRLLRQRSRPYLFSNTLAPAVVSASIKAIDILNSTSEYRDRLMLNTAYFRERMTVAGFDIREGIHPIVPIMLGDASVAKNMAKRMYEKGVYVVGFSYPVVPIGKARIRVQISALHTESDLNTAIQSFKEVFEEIVEDTK